MDSARKQLTDRLKSANNILVTVSRDPSVDQLAALLGLTLLLDKMGKHAAAVYSGETPSTIEFLQPEEVIEKSPDSLRDFIIALDKSKADKLRYKVEDNVVRIFITPYKTSISQADFEFSQGDFNVDVVVALGVARQEDLDETIINHGRILHDATVASLTVAPEDGGLGSINWHDPQASSLSELVAELAQDLGADLLDKQIATALLTGVVAETERFSNAKTSSQTMSVSAALMAAGADQQLVATKLEEGASLPPPAPDAGEISLPADTAPEPSGDDGGAIAIDHTEPAEPEPAPPDFELPPPQLSPADDVSAAAGLSPGAKLVTEPPTLGGTLTANAQPEGLDPSVDPMSAAVAPPLIGQDSPPSDAPESAAPAAPEPTPPADNADADLPAAPEPEPPLVLSSDSPAPAAAPAAAQPSDTLTDLEQAVHSPHLDPSAPPPDINAMRDEVNKALQSSPAAPAPITALGAQPFGGELHSPDAPPAAPDSPQVSDSNAPPPVPPPIPFQFGGSDNPPQS